VKFLLLDEVDQALDKQGVDVLAETITILSKDLKILIITHNEMMKEKFENIITVYRGTSGSILKQ
jgi:chromosome segregation ATPase